MRKYLLFSAIILSVSLQAQVWTQRANFGNVGRHRASGFAIGNKGYLGLGHVNGDLVNVIYKDWWEYDPASNSWTQKADYPTPSGNYGAIAFATSSKGYVGGGATLNGEFFEYNPQTNTWTAIANCPVSPTDQGSFAVNDKGYVLMGSALYEYDPATNNWTQQTSAPVAFSNWCVAFSIGASGYVKNGTSFYEFKPANNQWIQRAPFPGVNTNGAGAFVRNNRGYIVSGYVGSLANVTSQVWEYNPGNNTWTQLGDFLGTSRRFSVGFSINNKGYIGTGTNGINFNDFWELDEYVAVNDLASDDWKMNVFPNPATDYVEFVMSNPNASFNINEGEMQLYDLSGNIVSRNVFNSNRCVIERQSLPAGMYIYRMVHSNTTVQQGKIIFQ
ncbi:MAG: hypothetical protein Fur0041_18180 [Bacteroidia bacterium]